MPAPGKIPEYKVYNGRLYNIPTGEEITTVFETRTGREYDFIGKIEKKEAITKFKKIFEVPQ